MLRNGWSLNIWKGDQNYPANAGRHSSSKQIGKISSVGFEKKSGWLRPEKDSREMNYTVYPLSAVSSLFGWAR